LDVFENIPKHITYKYVGEMVNVEVVNEVLHKFIDTQVGSVVILVVF
jgi:hypothetical protein